MSKLSKHLILGGVAVVIGLSPVAWRLINVNRRLYAASAPAPFTVQQHTEMTGPHAGNAAVIETRTIALRGDGSRVNIEREPRKKWVERSVELSTGLLQTIYDDVEAVSTSQVSADELQRHLATTPDPSANCIASVSGKPLGVRPSTVLGSETRGGVPMLKILNGSGLTVWQAPSLACVTVEYFIDWDAANPGTNTSVLKMDSIARGEPDPSLFSVPSGYREMLPSAAKAAHVRFANVPEANVQNIAAQMAKTDEFYLSHRPAN